MSAKEIWRKVRGIEGDMGNHYTQYALQYFHGVALGVAIPSIERLHQFLTENGHTEFPTGLLTPSGKCFAPNTGDPYFSAVAFSPDEGRGMVAVLQHYGRPDPKMDEIMASMFAGHVPDHTPHGIFDCSVSHWDDGATGQKWFRDSSLRACFEMAAKESTLPREIISASPLRTPYREGEKYEYPKADLRLFDDVGAWYQQLGHALEASGLRESYLTDLDFARTREYENSLSTDEAAPLIEWGANQALNAGGLPTQEQIDEVTSLFLATVEERLESRSLPEALRSKRMCIELGFVSTEEAFDFNDLDSKCFSIDKGMWLGIALQDQNRNYALFWDNTEDVSKLLVHQWHRDEDDYENHPAARLRATDIEQPAPSLIGSFIVDKGHVTLDPSHHFSTELDILKSWNGVLFETGSAECCLEMEFEDRDIPLPDMSHLPEVQYRKKKTV